MKIMSGIVLLIALLFFCSCNIFNPTDARYGKMGADGWIQEGQKRIRSGQLVKANEAFTRAASMAPSKSEAWYGIAKVALMQVGFNIISLVRSFETSATSLPFIGQPMEQQDNLYVACQTAKSALKNVLDTLHSDGVVKPEWVKLDYATVLSIYTVLRLMDFNMDGRITADDNLIRLLQIRVDKNGLHMANFDSLLSTPTGRAAFNNFLDYSSSFVTETYSEIVEVFTGRSPQEEPKGFENVIFRVSTEITYYKVGDGIDNDGDGLIDEETKNGMDDDGDDRIDEDTKAPGAPKVGKDP